MQLLIGMLLFFFSATLLAGQEKAKLFANDAVLNQPELGLTKLHSALARLQSDSAITVLWQISMTDSHDGTAQQGNVALMLSADRQGFHVGYPSTVLANLDQEQQYLVELLNEGADVSHFPAPSLSALKKLQLYKLPTILNSAKSLSLLLQRATFLPKQSFYSPQQGSSENVLTFKLPLDTQLPYIRLRRYVSEFSAVYKIFISAAGVPLKSELAFEASGSAFIILHASAYGSQLESYQVVNNRLILSTSQSTKGSKSLFGDFERKQSQKVELVQAIE